MSKSAVTSSLSQGSLLQGLGTEESFLLLVVRQFLYQTHTQELTTLHQSLQWEKLLELAEEHRLRPVFYHSLNQLSGSDTLPLATLRDLARDNLMDNLALTQELRSILVALEAEGIPALVFKGLALAQMMYGNLGLREFGDIDILVSHENFARAAQLLQTLGFALELDIHWEAHFIHPETSCAVDLHRNVTPRFMPTKLSFETLFRQRHSLQLLGTPLSTLSLEDAIIMQCVHLVKDCWDVKTRFREHVRLHKLCDLARSLQHPEFQWSRLVERAHVIRAERMLLFGLHLAHHVLATPVPETLLSKASSNPLLRSLKGTPHTWFLGQQPSPGSSMSGIIFEMSLRENIGDRLALFFRPTQEDESSFRLPAMLHFLYYLTRPFRLLFLYGSWWLKTQVDRDLT